MTRRSALARGFGGGVLVALTATACGSGTPSGSAGDAGDVVVTSFYPLEFAAQRIVDGKLDVTVLTKPGAEPHDFELAPQDLTAMTKARVVIYSKGFQPAVDEGVAQVDAAKVLDVSGPAHLTLSTTADGQDESADGQDQLADGQDHSAGDGHGHAQGNDPHFWLDPQRYAAVAQAVGDRLAADDPANAGSYRANTAAFVAELDRLDGEFTAALKDCTITDLVTSHAAFGYLAHRYGFEQHGISGLSPEAEPSAAGLTAITELVKEHHITTIYQETLVEPHFAETVAGSTGATVQTLDPVEGITSASAGQDYFEVMRSNLATLVRGQGCR